MMMRIAASMSRRVGLLAVIVCAAGASSCKKTAAGPTEVTVTGMTVTGTSLVEAGSTAQLVATAQLSKGGPQVVTNDATWDTTNAAVATVSRGVVSGVGAGQSVIKATYQGVSGQATVTVAVVLEANPAVPYGPIEVGRTLQLTGLSSRASFGISDYRWDFGDGTTGSGPTPTKIYAEALVPQGTQRTFTITLTIVDNRGTTSSSRSTTVLVTHNY